MMPNINLFQKNFIFILHLSSELLEVCDICSVFFHLVLQIRHVSAVNSARIGGSGKLRKYLATICTMVSTFINPLKIV